MDHRQLGRTALRLSTLGFGAFKIGRNQGIKYPQPYDLPSEAQVASLLQGLLDLGITYIDTAPAYGLSEERLGKLLPADAPVIISTKVGETFEQGQSRFDYCESAIRRSIERSRQRLRRDVLDLVFVHSNGQDIDILEITPVVPVLQELKGRGVIRAIGFSGKTVEGARQSLDWADALMVEYHLQDRSHQPVMQQAMNRGVGIVVKKALASGRLEADAALRFVLQHPAVTSVVVGGLDLEHLRQNVAATQGQ